MNKYQKELERYDVQEQDIIKEYWNEINESISPESILDSYFISKNESLKWIVDSILEMYEIDIPETTNYIFWE